MADPRTGFPEPSPGRSVEPDNGLGLDTTSPGQD
jgi:hypothetical protein